jgi:hypothetical protein
MFPMSAPVRMDEPSYFNLIMTKRGVRRGAVPFAEAAGVLPELAYGLRVDLYARPH